MLADAHISSLGYLCKNTFYSLSVFLSAKSLQLILQIKATDKLVVYVLADY